MQTKVIKNLRRRGLMKNLHEKGFKKGVEVGVCTGKFSQQICEAIPGVELYGIDDYDILELRAARKGKDGQEALYKQALEKLKPYKNYTLVRESSMRAIHRFPFNSIDFVYIDGGHTFDDVMCDIIQWGKIVKKGGIISGHDAYNFVNGGIVPALEIYTKQHKIEKVYLTDERCPSFFFEKTW